MNIHLHSEGQECKTDPVRGILVGGKGGWEGKGGWIWLMSFIHLHEDRTLKPVKIIWSGGGAEEDW
jgi:hypothetical protein